MSNRSPAYKVVVIGDAQSGKSSLLFRFVHRRFNTFPETTVCCAFYSRILPSGQRVNMWDTAGQERYRALLPMYLKNIDLILYVYDTTNKNSFEHLDFWMKWVDDNATAAKRDDNSTTNGVANDTNDCYSAILIGNKTDLIDRRVVSSIEGANLAKTLGIPFVETSCLKGQNVEEVWEIVTKLLEKHPLTGPSGNSSTNLGSVVLDGVDKMKEHAKGCYGNCSTL